MARQNACGQLPVARAAAETRRHFENALVQKQTPDLRVNRVPRGQLFAKAPLMPDPTETHGRQSRNREQYQGTYDDGTYPTHSIPY